MRSTTLWPLALALTLVLAPACADQGDPDDIGGAGDEFEQLEANLDFLSSTAREYYFQGQTTVTIESALASAPREVRNERAMELIKLKHVALSWFLNQYLVEKDHEAKNAEYGGFKGLVKNGSYDELNVEPLDPNSLTYRYTFVLEAAAPNDLLSKLPGKFLPNKHKQVELKVGVVPNSDLAKLDIDKEWYRNAPWGSWDPDKVDAKLVETIDVEVWAEPATADSWIDLAPMIADGKLTMGAFFGWDYHADYHIKHAKEFYNWLVNSKGFKSPVASFDDYVFDKGPLTKTVKHGITGAPVQVEIIIVWGNPGTKTDPDTNKGGKLLEDTMRKSLKDDDVIIFSGHSGPFYGFALANWRKTSEGDLDDSELSSVVMEKNRSQLVVADGCDTYAIGQAFRLNPAKPDGKFIDIITTTTFSNASSINSAKVSIDALLQTSDGMLAPKRWREVIQELGYGYGYSAMYGVHGVDDNPRLHPFANPEVTCKTCKVNADCPGTGTACVKLSSTKRYCLPQCVDTSACGEGYRCQKISGSSYSWSHVSRCVPKTSKCVAMDIKPVDVTEPDPKPDPGASEALKLVINEVHPYPNKGAAGDTNGDGSSSSTKDEFVELFNAGSKTADLSGVTLSDANMMRLTFADGTKLAPHKAIVIWGGGTFSKFKVPSGVQALIAKKGLGLNNSGDTVTVRDAKGNVLDTFKYGKATRGVSWNRADDAAGGKIVKHAGDGYSVGTRSDGKAF